MRYRAVCTWPTLPTASSIRHKRSPISTFGKEVTVSITGMTGTLIRSFNAANNGSIPVNTGDIADGVYLVRVQSGDNVAVQRITVRR